MFNSQLHRAVMTHVKNKIKEAETSYQSRLEQADREHRMDVQSALEVREAKKVMALQESIQSVIKSLT